MTQHLTLRYLPKRDENSCPHKPLYVNDCSSFVLITPNLETALMSINL